MADKEYSLKILQTSVSCSLSSQGLLLAEVNRVGAQIICLSEPHLYKNRLSPTPGGKLCSLLHSSNFISGLSACDFAVKAKTGSVKLISIYLSPNEPVTGSLDELKNLILQAKNLITTSWRPQCQVFIAHQ